MFGRMLRWLKRHHKYHEKYYNMIRALYSEGSDAIWFNPDLLTVLTVYVQVICVNIKLHKMCTTIIWPDQLFKEVQMDTDNSVMDSVGQVI